MSRIMALERVALVVVDIQERLLPHISRHEAVLDNSVKLVKFASLMDLPILFSEQYPKGLGATVAPLRSMLGKYPYVEKTSFGCFGDAGFVSKLRELGREQLLVAGIETHVCVSQTVLAALDAGYQVFLLADCVSSRKELDHNIGLERMKLAGAAPVTTEMVMYELMRDAKASGFKQMLEIVKG